MKRVIASVALFVTSTVFASWDDPNAQFDATKYTNRTVSVTWITVKMSMLRETCNRVARKKGYQTYKSEINACAFWEGNVCTVYTPETTSMHTVGHEMRHCFQGAWH
jgi:hypothetical protein